MKRLFSKSLKSETGSISVEAILMFPLLVWAYMGMYVFFEGLRESNINLKATYTVADLLSREEEEMNRPKLERMHAVYRWMSRSLEDFVQLRVSVVRFHEDGDWYELMWSEPVNGVEDLEQADVSEVLQPHVPIMADQSSAIVVETWTIYQPIMRIGLQNNVDIYNIVVTSPRAGKLDWEGANDGTGSDHNDNVDDDPDNLDGT
jgi:hypothetical protein